MCAAPDVTFDTDSHNAMFRHSMVIQHFPPLSRAFKIKNRIIRYSIVHSILDTCYIVQVSSDRSLIHHSIYRSIAIPPSIDIERSQVSRYFDISSIEPALVQSAVKVNMLHQYA